MPGLRNRCTLACLLPHCTRHVCELTSSHSRTQCFLFPVGKKWCSPCTSLSPFFFIPSALPLTSLSILFSLILSVFLLLGGKDVRHSSVWIVLPSPSASLLLPPFLLSPFTEEEGGGGKGGPLSAAAFFCVCGIAKISTEHKKKWNYMWGISLVGWWWWCCCWGRGGVTGLAKDQGQHAQTRRNLMISVFPNSKEVWNLKTNSGLYGTQASTNNYSSITILRPWCKTNYIRFDFCADCPV